MTDLRDSLAQVVGLVSEMTPGELTVYDANDGDGWPTRPLWCFMNPGYDSDDEDAPVLQGSIHYGGKEDADGIAAAVNFLRTHGPALLAMMGRHGAGDAEDAARYRWLRGNLLWAKSYDGYVRWTVEILMPEPGIHEGHPPVAETLDEAIDAAMGAVGAEDHLAK